MPDLAPMLADRGCPAEVREGEEPKPDDKPEEDIPDPSTVESVGY